MDKIKYLLFITFLTCSSTQAAIIDQGAYTTDSTSGFHWLDVTYTLNLTHAEVESQLGTRGYV
jgi:hypothetical protein